MHALSRKRMGGDNYGSALSVCYDAGMEKQEKPTPLGDRVYKVHRKMLAKKARVLKVKRAEVTRMAIEAFCA